MADKEARQRAAQLQTLFGVTMEPGEVSLQLYKRHAIVLFQRAWWLTVVVAAALLLLWWAIQQIGASTLFVSLVVGTVVVGGLVFFLFYLDWRDDALILTNVRLLHVERVFFLFKSRQEVSLRDIQNVLFVAKGMTAALFNFGTVQIETAARVSNVIFGPIFDPKSAQQDIMARVFQGQAESSRQIMAQTFRHHLDPARFPPPVLDAGSGIKPAPQRRFLLPANPRFDGSTITWYKHNYFLIGAFLGPALFIVATVVVGFFLASRGIPLVVWLILSGCIVLGVFFLMLNYQRWIGRRYMVTPDRAMEVARTPWGLFGERRRTVNLANVQDITFKKPGLLANLLDFGYVTVSYAGGKLEFLAVPRPADVQREIYQRQRLFRLQEEQRRRDRFAEAAAIFTKIDEGDSSASG